MRWVICHPGPGWSVVDVFNGWHEALAGLGQQVIGYNLGDRLLFYDAAHLEVGDGTWRKALTDDNEIAGMAVNGLAAMLWRVRPQILLIISGFFADPGILDHARMAYGTKVVIIHTECPYEDDKQAGIAAHADLNLVNDPVSLKAFEAAAPSVYCPHGWRPAVHHPGPPDPALACDLAFTGTGFKSRVAFLEAMNLDGLDVTLAGNWMAVPDASPLRKYLPGDGNALMDNDQTAALYRSMKAGINLYRREANADTLIEGHACGPREIEMAACGAFFLRDPRPESDVLFPMLPSFTSPEEAGDLLRWWLARDGLREKRAAQAREAVAGRSFTHHARHLLRLLGIKELPGGTHTWP